MSKEAKIFTIGEAVFNLRTKLKELSDDSYYTSRFIYSQLKSARNQVIKQSGDKLSLLDGNAIQTITCLNMLQTDLSECCNIKLYRTINRSKERIPSILDSKLQRRYIRLFNMDRSKIYDYNSAEGILQQDKMKYKYPTESYFIENSYLYYTGKAEILRLSAIFENPEDVEVFNQCEENECYKNTNCTFVPMLKREFKIPGYLQKMIEDLAMENILRSRQIGRIDEDNNGKDDSMN